MPGSELWMEQIARCAVQLREYFDHTGTYTVLILVGVMLMACTTKIMSLMNNNTISVLRAIADLRRR